MPALDIGQIRGEAQELARLYGDREAFAAGTREFFQVHSSPNFRQSPVVSLHAPLKTYGTPAPVLRTMLGAIRKFIGTSPAHAQAVAERLWQDAIREQRQLAISLLGLTAAALPAQAEAIMLHWLDDLDDIELVDRLGAEVCGPWIAGDVYSRLEKVRLWVNSPHKYRRQFAVKGLGALAQDRAFRDVSAILNIMPGLMRENDIEVRKGVAYALKDLSLSGPGEVSRFLIDWADTLDKNTNWIVRHAMEKLDADTRGAVTTALRGGGRPI